MSGIHGRGAGCLDAIWPNRMRSLYVRFVDYNDPRALQHALAILRESIAGGPGRPLTTCEKLACRMLLPVVGRRALVHFCETVEGANPLYRKSHLALSCASIERDVQRYLKTCR